MEGKVVIIRYFRDGNVWPVRVKKINKNGSADIEFLDYDGFELKEETVFLKDMEILEVLD